MEDKYFSLGCQLCMQRNYFFLRLLLSKASVTHLSIFIYRFLLGQIEISNKAVGREVKEISLSLLGLPGIDSPLCCQHRGQGFAWTCSPSWQQNAVGAEELGRSRWRWFVRTWSLFPLPGKPGHDGLIGWAVSSLAIEKTVEWIKFSVMSRRISFPAVIAWFHLQYVSSVLRMCGLGFAFVSAQPSWGHTNGSGEEVCLYLQLLICSKSIAVTWKVIPIALCALPGLIYSVSYCCGGFGAAWWLLCSGEWHRPWETPWTALICSKWIWLLDDWWSAAYFSLHTIFVLFHLCLLNDFMPVARKNSSAQLSMLYD